MNALNKDMLNIFKMIFIKILFQEFLEYNGLTKFNKYIKNRMLQEVRKFPTDDPKNMRFTISFMSVDLGGDR